MRPDCVRLLKSSFRLRVTNVYFVFLFIDTHIWICICTSTARIYSDTKEFRDKRHRKYILPFSNVVLVVTIFCVPAQEFLKYPKNLKWK